MTVRVLIEKDDKGFSVYTDNLKHGVIIGEGKNVEEAKADFFNSWEEIKSIYPDRGLKIPDEMLNPKFEFKYDVSSVFDELDVINTTKFAKMAGVNSSLLRHYKCGDFPISDKQVKKIENALHDLGRRLLSVSMF